MRENLLVNLYFIHKEVGNLCCDFVQKMVASQTDKNMAMKKEVGDLDTFTKRNVAETSQKFEDIQRDIIDLKRKVETLERKVETTSSLAGSSGGGNVPGKQLGIYEKFGVFC